MIVGEIVTLLLFVSAPLNISVPIVSTSRCRSFRLRSTTGKTFRQNDDVCFGFAQQKSSFKVIFYEKLLVFRLIPEMSFVNTHR